MSSVLPACIAQNLKGARWEPHSTLFSMADMSDTAVYEVPPDYTSQSTTKCQCDLCGQECGDRFRWIVAQRQGRFVWYKWSVCMECGADARMHHYVIW